MAALLVEPPFAEWSAEIGGANVRIVEAGTGTHVLALGAGFAGGAAHRALAQHFHVIAFEASHASAKQIGEAAAGWIAGKKIEKIGLLAIAGAAPAALWAASIAGEAVNAIVLASPQGLPLGDAQDEIKPLLREVQAPKAVLLGTDDPGAPKSAAALIKKSLSRCNVVLVYGTGADIAADRPDAFAKVAGDFFDRQARFSFVSESVAISA